MAQLPYHPAPGLGEILPGFYVVPQNPMVNDRVTYTPRIGDILPGKFPVPQNPIKDYMAGRIHQIAREPGQEGTLNGNSLSGCGGGCGGGCGCSSGLSGISEDFSAISAKISAGDYMGAIQAPVFGIPLWGVLAGVVAATMMMGGSSGGGRRR